MSENDSFISEVTEEIRRERLFRFLRRYGWLIAAGVVLVVGGAGLNEWRKARLQAGAEAAGDAMRAAYIESDPVARSEALATLAAETPRAAPLIRIAQAGSLLEAGDSAAAAALLAAVAEDGAVDETYRVLASLQRVMALGADMEFSERGATLDLLAAESAPFRLMAIEQRALLRLEEGDAVAARSDLQTILQTPGAPEQLVARARQLIIASGGGLDPAALPDGAASGG